jgi:hypothetical protein
MISYEMPSQSSCKMWLWRLGFSYGSSMMMLHHIFFLKLGILEKSVTRIRDRKRWTDSMPGHSPDLIP